MNFLFKYFILFFYITLISCTSGKKDEGQPFFEDEEDTTEDYLQPEEIGVSKEVNVSENREYDDEELEFMTQRTSIESDSVNNDDSFMDDDMSSDQGSDIYSDTDDEMLSDEPLYNESESTTGLSLSESKKQNWIPLKKIPQTTWMHNKKWINAVYIVRPDENLMTINQKIYRSEDRQEELKSANPFLKRREPKVGDKIYYNSPIRPKDRNQFLVYYEDQKQIPLSHDIEKGENIREIASQLLGHKDSWKEIWATNLQVDSKWVVNKKVTVQYWPDNENISLEPQIVESPEIEEMAMNDNSDSIPPLPEDTNMDADPLHEGIEESIIEIDNDDMIPDLGDIPEAEGPSPLVEPAPLPEEEATSETASSAFQNWKVKGGIVASILIIIAIFFGRLIRNRKKKSDFDFSRTNIDIDEIEE